MGFKATGNVHFIGDTKTIGANGFQKRELVVEIADNPKYPQLVQFEATKDRCLLFDQLGIGDTVTIEFDLRGREWRSAAGEVKYFNTLNVWKLEVTTKAEPKAAPIVGGGGSVQDDIPFAPLRRSI